MLNIEIEAIKDIKPTIMLFQNEDSRPYKEYEILDDESKYLNKLLKELAVSVFGISGDIQNFRINCDEKKVNDKSWIIDKMEIRHITSMKSNVI